MIFNYNQTVRHDSKFFCHRIQVLSVDAKIKILFALQQTLQCAAEPVSLQFYRTDFIQQDSPDCRIGNDIADNILSCREGLPQESEAVESEALLLRWNFIILAQSYERSCCSGRQSLQVISFERTLLRKSFDARKTVGRTGGQFTVEPDQLRRLPGIHFTCDDSHASHAATPKTQASA